MKNVITKLNVTIAMITIASPVFAQTGKTNESWGTRALAGLSEIGAFKLFLVAGFGLLGLYVMGISFWKLWQYFDTSARQQNNINIPQSVFGVFVGLVLMALSAGAALSANTVLGDSTDVTDSINNTYGTSAPN